MKEREHIRETYIDIFLLNKVSRMGITSLDLE